MIPCYQAMEYLSKCRQQGGVSSPGEFYWFLNKFQQASRWFLCIDFEICNVTYKLLHKDSYLSLCLLDLMRRNFAKRQMTWFRCEPMYHWLNASRPLVIYIHVSDSIQSLYVTIGLLVINPFGTPCRMLYLNSFMMHMRTNRRRWWCQILSGWTKTWEILERLMHSRGTAPETGTEIRTLDQAFFFVVVVDYLRFVESLLWRHFVGREDCSSVLEWISSEGCKSEVSV